MQLQKFWTNQRKKVKDLPDENKNLSKNAKQKWIGGQFFWSTGKMGCPHDLAGLVVMKQIVMIV